MSEKGDISFCELRTKEVVNSTDGRRMGRIVDLIFSLETGKVKGIVVPLARRTFFGKNQDIFIPWHCVQKIGEDVILINVTMNQSGQYSCKPPRPTEPACPCEPSCQPDPCKEEKQKCCNNDMPACDRRCEKCMLFDCQYRWAEK